MPAVLACCEAFHPAHAPAVHACCQAFHPAHTAGRSPLSSRHSWRGALQRVRPASVSLSPEAELQPMLRRRHLCEMLPAEPDPMGIKYGVAAPKLTLETCVPWSLLAAIRPSHVDPPGGACTNSSEGPAVRCLSCIGAMLAHPPDSQALADTLFNTKQQPTMTTIAMIVVCMRC